MSKRKHYYFGNRTDELANARDYCETVYEYRKLFLKSIREIVRMAHILTEEQRNMSEYAKVEKHLTEAETLGELKIDVRRGTIYCIPYHLIIERIYQPRNQNEKE